ncbi:MAG: phosphatase PAP2 family protein [Firmicutes bacterium]|nr:phosphatase PAP2 family protein [Bacillota bacterium]
MLFGTGWQLAALRYLQSIHTPQLDQVFYWITMGGSASFYLVLLPILYWCVNKRLAFRTGVVFLLSVYVNDVAKGFFHTPRPDPAQVRVIHPETGGGYAFPSGHTQDASTFWVYLAAASRQAWVWILGILAIVAVGLSRLYLGVHWPEDVLGGLLIGVLIAVIALRITESLDQSVRMDAFWLQLLVALGLPLLLLLLSQSPMALKVVGFLEGLSAGYVLDGAVLNFHPRASLGKQVIKVFIGLAVLFLLQTGLKNVFPAGAMYSVLRYAIMGFWASFLAPALFVLLLGRERR